MVRSGLWLLLGFRSGLWDRVKVNRALIFPSEPSTERVKVSHMIVECRLINYHSVKSLKLLSVCKSSEYREY